MAEFFLFKKEDGRSPVSVCSKPRKSKGNGKKAYLRYDLQFFGGRGGSSGIAGGGNLPTIQVNESWLYQPDSLVDPSDMRKNPIPFVGVGEDARLAELFDGYDTIQERSVSNTEVNINGLKTLQPFVLQSGIDSPKSWDGSERPYVVQFEGVNYLIDGNHRVAKAKLDGHKTIRVDLSVLRRR